MTTWSDLINQLKDLDDLANKFQLESPQKNTTPEDKIEDFQIKYQEWYTDCLSQLEDQLKARFEHIHEIYARLFVLDPTSIIPGEYGGYTTLQYSYTHRYKDNFKKAVFEYKDILLQASKKPHKPALKTPAEAVEIIKSIATNFHLFVHALNKRHDERAGFIEIKDEYDVQDIIDGLLRLFFKDIRREEASPSYGGNNSRIDFLLIREQIIIEIKKTRPGLKNKEVRKQLLEDIASYQKHPQYNTFLGFVYDPEKCITNPDGLVDDLQETFSDKQVIIIINQN